METFAFIIAATLSCADPANLPTRAELDAAAKAVGVRSIPHVLVIKKECWEKQNPFYEGEYDDDTQTVLIPSDWRKRLLARVVLIHEFRHHQQNLRSSAIWKVPMAERECDAYTFTASWAMKKGYTVEAEDQAKVGITACVKAIVDEEKALKDLIP